MDREGAHRLWQGTLGLGPLAADAPSRARLQALWRAAGVPGGEVERLLAALPLEAGDLERRHRVVRETRRWIRAAGFDPDLLSTPAAGMRGL